MLILGPMIRSPGFEEDGFPVTGEHTLIMHLESWMPIHSWICFMTGCAYHCEQGYLLQIDDLARLALCT